MVHLLVDHQWGALSVRTSASSGGQGVRPVTVRSGDSRRACTNLDVRTRAGDRATYDVPVVADTGAAQRWRFSMRRIDAVSVHLTGDVVRCSVTGVGQRMPVRRRVSPEIGLGLAALGVPVRLISPGSAGRCRSATARQSTTTPSTNLRAPTSSESMPSSRDAAPGPSAVADASPSSNCSTRSGAKARKPP